MSSYQLCLLVVIALSLYIFNKFQRDDIFKQEGIKEKTAKDKKQVSEASPPLKNNKKSAKQQTAINSNTTEATPVVEKEAEEKVVESTVLPQTNGIVGNPGKEKKKKKSEFNTRQQLCKLHVILFLIL